MRIIKKKAVFFNVTALFPTWSTLNRLGKSRVLRTSYLWLVLVPLCAKILSHIGDELYLTIFGETFIITMALPFSWKAFFYASVAFSAASLGYAISCPAIVRDCESFSGFVEQGKGATQIIEAFQSYLWPLRRDWAVNEFLSTFCKVEKDTRKKTVYVDSPISSYFYDERKKNQSRIGSC